MKSVTDEIADRLEAEANERGMSTRHCWIGLDGEEHGPISPPDGDHCPNCGNGFTSHIPGYGVSPDAEIQDGEERAAFKCRACGASGVRVRYLAFDTFEDVKGPDLGHAKAKDLILLPDTPAESIPAPDADLVAACRALLMSYGAPHRFKKGPAIIAIRAALAKIQKS